MEEKRAVPREKAEAIARAHGIRHIETSAKSNININQAFMELTESILIKVRSEHTKKFHQLRLFIVSL